MGLLQRLQPLTHGGGEDATELAGLGILAAPSVDEAQAHVRAALAHDYNKPGVTRREFLPHATKPATEVAGLGVLAVPSALKLMGKHATAALFDELLKLGAISDDEARRSLDRLDTLEKAAPTTGQVARYGALGAGAGALGHVVSRAVEGGASKPTLRSGLGAAASGALAMGAVPLVRSALDRTAEKHTLRSYLSQEHVGEYGKNQGASTDAEPPTGLSRAGYNV